MTLIAVLDLFTQAGTTPAPPFPDPPDPNVLYAAVIQASATIVAIVGGFVTATVVNIVTERQSIKTEVADLERATTDARQEQSAAEEARDRMRAQYLLWTYEEDLLEMEPHLASVGQAYRRLKARDIPISIFTEEWEAFALDVESAKATVATFQENWRTLRNEMPDLDAWLQSESTDLSLRGERLASVWYEVINEKARASAPYDSIQSLVSMPHSDSASIIEADWNRSERERWERAVDGSVNRTVEATAEARRIAAALDRQRGRLRYVRQPPPDLWLGFVALLILAIGGIGYPLLLMPQPAADFDNWDKSIVLVPFIIGMVLSFGYVVRLFRRGSVPPPKMTQGAPSSGIEAPLPWWRRLLDRVGR